MNFNLLVSFFIFLRTMVPFAKNSLPNGLELLIDAESYDYAVSSTGSEGIVMSILYQLDIPIMKNIGINLQPGQTLGFNIFFFLLEFFKYKVLEKGTRITSRGG